ncbi:MAG TPA: 2-amino-4-hydroxy-6-hydroxymethyldihydropteridine diphosphokinase [Bacillota bacterium]
MNDNNLIFIGLGSNLGDSLMNLKTAVEKLEATFQVRLTVSSVYRSEPVEVIDQPWFFNQVAYFTPNGEVTPLNLLRQLKDLEKQLGRTPGVRYGPRVIDLDLLFFKNWIFQCDCLSIPHAQLLKRSFVLQPLAEIAPQWPDPRTGLTMSAIWERQKEKLSFCEKVASGKVS